MPVCALCGQETDLVAKQKFKNAMSTYVNQADGKKSIFNDDVEKFSVTDKEGKNIVWVREDKYVAPAAPAKTETKK